MSHLDLPKSARLKAFRWVNSCRNTKKRRHIHGHAAPTPDCSHALPQSAVAHDSQYTLTCLAQYHTYTPHGTDAVLPDQTVCVCGGGGSTYTSHVCVCHDAQTLFTICLQRQTTMLRLHFCAHAYACESKCVRASELVVCVCMCVWCACT